MVQGAAPAGPANLDEAAQAVRLRVEAGQRRKAAAAEVAATTGLPAKDVYDASVAD